MSFDLAHAHQDPLLQVLLEQDYLSPEQADDLFAEHQESGTSVRQILIDREWMMEDDLLGAIAAYLGTDVIELHRLELSQQLLQSIPASVARMYNVLPVSVGQGQVTLATFDLVGPEVTDELTFVLTSDVAFVMAREADIRAHVNQFYGDDSESVNEMLNALESEMEEATDVLEVGDSDEELGIEEAAGAAPVIRFVNLVLYQAVQARASDIHFEPFESEFRIRYRVDGALYELSPPPKRLALPVISRVKVMSGLNIAERRLPQDGRIQLTVAGKPIDLRVSTLPTQFGESVVLRVLDRSVVSLDLENLGFPEDVMDTFVRDIMKPNGIVVVTGPTGSGKTTTLYSALRKINTIERKLLTAEEPVEYDIEGIIQVPVNGNLGNTFQRVLRAFLRQDPDVMMVGEIRDLETAQIAVQASLTGHLVFSTLHTNDAAGAITRLIDMNVEPYLISSTIEAIVGQRLLRKICDSCKKEYQPEDGMLDQLGVGRDELEGRPFYFGEGCAACNHTGYRGRQGIYEYLSITDAIRELINERKPTLVIRDKAVELGMRTMRQDGIRNILDGYTTVDEVLRYT